MDNKETASRTFLTICAFLKDIGKLNYDNVNNSLIGNCDINGNQLAKDEKTKIAQEKYQAQWN